MSINCSELKKALGNDALLYKKVIRADNVELLDELKKHGYDSLQDFFSKIEMKLSLAKINVEELKPFHEYLHKGYEASHIATSNTYGYIRKIHIADSLENTLQLLDKVLKGELSANVVKKQLEIHLNEANYIDTVIKEFTGDETLVKGSKEYKELQDQIRRQTKAYYVDHTLLHLLENGTKKELEAYTKILTDKKYISEAEGFMFGTYAASLNKRLSKEIKELVGEEGKFFMDAKTAERNVMRITTNGKMKRFGNYYNIYSESFNKYNDVLLALENKRLSDVSFIQKRASEFVERLNKNGYNANIVNIYDNGTALIRDNVTGETVLLDRSAFTTNMDDIINYFTKIQDGGEATIKTISDESEAILNGLDKPEIEEKDVEEVIKAIKNKDTLTNKEKRIYSSIIEKFKEGVILEKNDLIKLSEIRLLFGDKVGEDFLKGTDFLIAYNAMNNAFGIGLQTNMEYIQSVDANLHKILIYYQGVSETLVKKMFKAFLKKAREFEKPEVFNKYVEKETFYAALEALPEKWLFDKDGTVSDLFFELELFYNKIKEIKNSDDEIKIELAKFIEAKQPTNVTNKLSYDVIYNKIEEAHKKLIQSRTERQPAGYVAYLKWKYEGAEDLLDIGTIAREYYDMFKMVDKSLDEEKFIEAFTNKVRGIVKGQRNLANVFVKLRTSTEAIDHGLYIGTKKLSADSTVNEYNGYIATKLKEAGIKESTVRRIVDDLLGKSLYKSDGLLHWLGKMKGWTSRLLLTPFGGKGIGIAIQNLYSGLSLGFTRYSDESGRLAKEVGEELSKIKGFEGFLDDIFDPATNQIGKWLEEVERPIGEKVVDWLNIKLSQTAGKIGGTLEINKLETLIAKGDKEGIKEMLPDEAKYLVNDLFNDSSKVEAKKKIIEIIKNKHIEKVRDTNIIGKAYEATVGLPGMVDDLVYKSFLRDRVLSKILTDYGITAEEVKKLAETPEGLEKLKTLLQKARAEAIAEYQTFFKSGYHSGLTRNSFSRMIWVNFFSSWGSKMFGENLFHLFLKPRKNAIATFKLTGSLKSAIDSYVYTLISSSRFQELVKQMVLGSKIAYELQKDKDVDGNPMNTLINSTIAYQGWVSFVATRAIGTAINDMYNIAENTNGDFKDKTIFSLAEGLRTFLKNGLREVVTIGNLPYSYAALLAKGQLDSESAWYLTKFWLLNNINNSAAFSMYDLVGKQYKQRFDDKTELGTLEGLIGWNITSWSDVKEKMNANKRFERYLKDPVSYLENSSKLALLGTAYISTNSWKEHKKSEILLKDKNLLRIQNEAVLPEEYYNDVGHLGELKKIINASSLLNGWDVDNVKSIDQGKLQLAFNDLREKGYDPNKIIEEIKSGILNGKQAKLAKILTLLNSKASSAVLLSYATINLIKNKETLAKKIYGKNIPDDVKIEIEGGIIRNVLPQLARLDRNLHAKLLGLYIKNTYMTKGSDMADIFGTKVTKELQTKLFAQVADVDETHWTNDKFNSIPTRLLDGVKNEDKPYMINKIFDWIDEANVHYDTNIVAKAMVLYNNYDQIKNLLKENPRKFGPAADKLAELIWDVDEAINKNPNLLTDLSLIGGNKKIKFTQAKLELPKTKLPTIIKHRIKDLKDLTIHLPDFDLLVKNRIYKKIYPKIKIKPFNYELPKYEKGIKETKLHTYKPGELRTKLLEVKRKYLKSKRVRKPKVSSIKKVLRKTESNKGNRAKIKPSRPNR